jgi:hypothetical protein
VGLFFRAGAAVFASAPFCCRHLSRAGPGFAPSPPLVDSALLALLALCLGANVGKTFEAIMSKPPQDNEFIRVVYFDLTDKQVKEAAPQASLTEAASLVEALFRAKAAIFAQILRKDGFVLDNCAPLPPAA